MMKNELENMIGTTESEQSLRENLAALYHVIAHLGWDELIYTHSSVRVPGTETFLINPYGLQFDEVTAENLIKVDVEGNVVGGNAVGANYAGFVIHSAIHMARDYIHCIIHTHTTAGMAVSCQEDGLLPLSMYAHYFYDRLGYHEFEGPSMGLDERTRIVASLGKHNALMMRNHGLIAGGRTIPEAFAIMFRLQRACEVQLAAQSGNAKLHMPSAEVCAESARLTDEFLEHAGAAVGVQEFDAMVRLVKKGGILT